VYLGASGEPSLTDMARGRKAKSRGRREEVEVRDMGCKIKQKNNKEKIAIRKGKVSN